MNWLDIILDHVSKYKMENISKIEKEYLNQYDTDNKSNIEEVLNERYEYYKKAVDYDTRDIFYYEDQMMGDLMLGENLKETRLSLLWEILLDDDYEVFCKIYDIPYMIISSEWINVEQKYRNRFEDFWKSYYNFNI